MKKQINNSYTATSTNKNQFRESNNNSSLKKTTRYIYTEEDLGEGILDAGVTTAYSRVSDHVKANKNYKGLYA